MNCRQTLVVAFGSVREVPEQTCNHRGEGRQVRAHPHHSSQPEVSHTPPFMVWFRFLMPKAFTVGEVLSVVRSKLNLTKD